MSRVRFLAAAGTAALLAVSFPAEAQTSKDSPGRITPGSATSACIGAATSPTCATETLFACLTRGDAALCRTVSASAPSRTAGEAIQSEYAIERISVIRPEDVTEDLRDVDWFKPGYTLIEALRRNCPAAEATCSGESWDDFQVYLRPRPDTTPPLWDIVYWRSESEPDVPQELLDDAQRKPSP